MKARLLLVQPSLQPPGGGNGVAAWMVEALQKAHEVSVLTWEPPDFAQVDRYFGTSLRRGGFEVLCAPPNLRDLRRILPLRLDLLWSHILLTQARRSASSYDLLLTANNESDLGRPGIQYVHFPKFFLPRPDPGLRGLRLLNPVLRIYQRACAAATGFSRKRMLRNVTLANSNWTARKIRAVHGGEPLVLYPPVPTRPARKPWEAREDGFVCVGRFSPEKELEKVADIVAGLRSRGHDLKLHLAGAAGNPATHRRILRRAKAEGGWLRLHEGLARPQLADLLESQKYGLHGMREEHFGIGVAQSVLAGCLTFVPNGGGQVEIVGNDPDACYESVEDAVRKIERALADRSFAVRLRERQAAASAAFGVEAFQAGLLALVARSLNGRRKEV